MDNIENETCHDCENQQVHIYPLNEVEDIEISNDFKNETDDNEEYQDTVLHTFYQKR